MPPPAKVGSRALREGSFLQSGTSAQGLVPVQDSYGQVLRSDCRLSTADVQAKGPPKETCTTEEKMLVLSRGRKRRPANTAFSKASQLKLQPKRPRTPHSPFECVGSASIFDQMPDLVMRELSALISFTDWLRASQVLTAWRPFPPQRLTLSDSDIWYNLPANARVPTDHVLLRIDTENGGPSGPFGACPVILRAISHFGLSLDSVTSIDLSTQPSKLLFSGFCRSKAVISAVAPPKLDHVILCLMDVDSLHEPDTSKQISDGGVVVVEPVLVLAGSATEDGERRRLDRVSQLTPAVLHGGVLCSGGIGDGEVA
nr:unnamed protein product [Spirometra erinaceieuropaei]